MQFVERRGKFRLGVIPKRHAKFGSIFKRPMPHCGKSTSRRLNTNRVVLLSVASRSRTQLPQHVGKGRQPLTMRRNSIATDELIKCDTRREILKHQEPGNQVGGNHARSKVDPQFLRQEPQRGRLIGQPPTLSPITSSAGPSGGGPSSTSSPSAHPLHNDRPAAIDIGIDIAVAIIIAAHDQHPRDGPRPDTLPPLNGNRRMPELCQDSFHRSPPRQP